MLCLCNAHANHLWIAFAFVLWGTCTFRAMYPISNYSDHPTSIQSLPSRYSKLVLGNETTFLNVQGSRSRILDWSLVQMILFSCHRERGTWILILSRYFLLAYWKLINLRSAEEWPNGVCFGRFCSWLYIVQFLSERRYFYGLLIIQDGCGQLARETDIFRTDKGELFVIISLCLFLIQKVDETEKNGAF